MKTFYLPDLGEGLPDAEIHEWHVKEGDHIETDQLLVSMETAKAVVEVPAPHAGYIAKLHGTHGDIILTGAPLVDFVEAQDQLTATKTGAEFTTSSQKTLEKQSAAEETIFHLPDLGEGLPDAEIHEWRVKVGDDVSVDDELVAMETAKAVVEVPSPRSGKIAKLHGKPGDVILTGAPLVEFASESKPETAIPPSPASPAWASKPASEKEVSSAATVVGNIQTSEELLQESPTGLKPVKSTHDNIKALPAARILAKKHQIDLSQIKGTGPQNLITPGDVDKFMQNQSSPGSKDSADMNPSTKPSSTAASTSRKSDSVFDQLIASYDFTGAEPMRGVKRTMAQMMQQSHQEIVPVTLMDDADIFSWKQGEDVTFRIIRAMTRAAQIEPAMNAWYDATHQAVKRFPDVLHLGLAVDSKDGLFVPVIKNAEQKTATEMREIINRFKTQVNERTIPASELRGATITLSNFGTFAGRYANPVIVPPMVAILGCGRMRSHVVMVNECVESHRLLPLSLTFDHRAATGGEAARFLQALIHDLQLSN